MNTDISRSDDVKVGEIFTPPIWAEWLIKQWSIFDAWLDGASVCDPTAGQGAFALAMFRIARARGIQVTPELLSRLTLIEIRSSHLRTFVIRANREFGITFPSSRLLSIDTILNPPEATYDVLFGNPPWSNFADLPAFYKERLKSHFVQEGLVPDKKQALLGSSRVDIAALVLKVVLGKLLRKNGECYFYLPLSVFFGDNAHKGFRTYFSNHRHFSICEVYEFNRTKIFENVGTSYGCAKFRMDVQQRFPVRYFKEGRDGWIEYNATPLINPDDQWRILKDDEDTDLDNPIEVKLSPAQKPRQGVNTCGANNFFIFTDNPTYLPEQFIFPLATKEMWKTQDAVPCKWILLPYDRQTGRPLSWCEIEQHEALRRYLIGVRCELQQRKGTLIRSAVRKGIWWSLFGVGPYSFAPYKVIWEAYGKDHFRPIILASERGQVWQANQALHAFIPCWNAADAERIHSALLHPGISALLKQLNGSGKCNWAQPGKMKKILAFGSQGHHQPLLI